MEDGQIIEMYWQRNERAIQETQKKYGAYCYWLANDILSSREDAEECVSDTWLRAWDTMPPQRPVRLKLYLARITRNLSFDRYRAARTQKRGAGETALALEELEQCLTGSTGVESLVEAAELEKSINKFLGTLPERERNIFLRRYFYVEATAEIARKYRLRESNVFMILSRTRRKLRTHLQKEGYIP